MRFAFMFDGQGAQTPGMGKDLYEAFPVFRETFDQVDPTGRYRELCFNGTAEDLADTRNTQPCLVALEVSLAALMESEGLTPSLSFGLSLGAYAALASAGAFTPEEAVRAVAFRAQAMADATEACNQPFAMMAILGLTEEQVREACAVAAPAGYVTPTNFNCPGQIVISGEKAAVEAAVAAADDLGAKRCMPLAVSGPFHTKFMEPASKALEGYFAANPPRQPQRPFLFDTTAAPLAEGETVAEMLQQQVQSSISFQGCVQRMAADGITVAVELGAGNSLTKLVKRIDPAVKRLAVYDAESFMKVREQLRSLEGEESHV
ncbi:MAG: ACP S-malonyltransferase [Eggerthellales bacterium]|nr:ACP S-malonyltransferase [Eggerthellales bacterium]